MKTDSICWVLMYDIKNDYEGVIPLGIKNIIVISIIYKLIRKTNLNQCTVAYT